MSRRALALVAICGGVFLAFLDTTIVNTSFPDIRRGFDDASPAAAELGARRLLHRARGAARAGGRDRRPARAPARVPLRRRPLRRHERAVRRRAQLGAARRGPRAAGHRRSDHGALLARAAASALPARAPCRGRGHLGRRRRARRGDRVRRWAASSSRWPTGAGSSSSTCRSARRVIAAGARRSTRAATRPRPACRTCRGRGAGRGLAGPPRARPGGGQQLGLGERRHARLVRGLRAAARRRGRRPLPAPSAADRGPRRSCASPRSATARSGTLLFAAAFFSMILGNILFLTGVWGYSVLDAGLAVAPGPLASAIDRRPRRPPRRPLRPPRGDRARHALLRRRPAGPARRGARARLRGHAGCRASCWSASASASPSPPWAPPPPPTSRRSASASRAPSPARAASWARCSAPRC